MYKHVKNKPHILLFLDGVQLKCYTNIKSSSGRKLLLFQALEQERKEDRDEIPHKAKGKKVQSAKVATHPRKGDVGGRKARTKTGGTHSLSKR